MLNSFLLFLFKRKHTFKHKRIIFWCKLVELIQERHLYEAKISEDFEIIIVIIEVVLHPFLFLPVVMSYLSNIFLPLHNQLNNIKSKFGQMIETV